MDCSCQALLSMGFPRQESWSGLPFPSPGDLPDPGIQLASPAWLMYSLSLSYLGSLVHFWWEYKLVQPPWKTVYSFLKNKKNKYMIQQFYYWVCIQIKWKHQFETLMWKDRGTPNIHSSTKSQVPSNRWRGEEHAVCLYTIEYHSAIKT